MRNRALHDALRAFAEAAALQLSSDAAGGEEVPFEVVEQPGSGTSMYCYRPLTAQFIRQRIGVLGRLPSYASAGDALERLGGLDGYLVARGEPRIPADRGERADAALRSFLSSIYDGTSEFVYEESRFARAYGELEARVYEDRVVSCLLVPVFGLELGSPSVDLGEGLVLARGDTVPDAPAEAVWSGPWDRPAVLAVHTREGDAADGSPGAEAGRRFRRLLTALRLFEPGDYALGPAVWIRTDASPWRLFPIGDTGLAGGSPLLVQASDEDELRAFCNLIARRIPVRGEIAWALARFEMGAARATPFESLTDHLMALRALLEPEGPASGRLAQRLAVICAVPEHRAELAERVAHAVSLERAVIAGIPPATGAEAIALEMAGHLRALLRDVLCGHLDADLRGVADGMLGLREDAPTPAHGFEVASLAG